MVFRLIVGTVMPADDTRVTRRCLALMKVLVIDDYKGFRDELRRMLTRHGHEVDDSESASEAVAPAETGNYDVILLDYQMPENDGLWFLRNARVPRRTKVLLVTSHTEPRLIAEMFRAGAAGYLIKPFDEDDLIRNLAFYTNGRALPRTDMEIAVEGGLRNPADVNKGSADGGAARRRLV